MFFKFRKKPIVLTVHGFGQKRHHEMDDLAAFLSRQGYEVIQFDLYDLNNPSDADIHKWIERAEQAMKKALSKSSEVYVVSFSMGGVISSYLATIYPIKALVLVAPAFQYINLQLAKTITMKTFSSTSPSASKAPSKAQTKAFTEIVSRFKESIAHVTCPILILHGTKDEVIDPSSSHSAFKKIDHPKKCLLYLEGAPHRLLYTKEFEKPAFSIILSMLQGKLV